MNKLQQTNKAFSSKIGIFYLIALLLFILALFCQFAIKKPYIPLVDLGILVGAVLLGSVHICAYFFKKRQKKGALGTLILGTVFLIFGITQAGEIILNVKGDSRILSTVSFIFTALIGALILISIFQERPLFVYEYYKPRGKVMRRLEKIGIIICLIILILWVFIVLFLPIILK